MIAMISGNMSGSLIAVRRAASQDRKGARWCQRSTSSRVFSAVGAILATSVNTTQAPSDHSLWEPRGINPASQRASLSFLPRDNLPQAHYTPSRPRRVDRIVLPFQTTLVLSKLLTAVIHLRSDCLPFVFQRHSFTPSYGEDIHSAWFERWQPT